ncbi:hypothetical protein E1B28_013190 [Marasmius oreades]|uniref:Uncharacterized protein n=1 Tax=Marasmius oreades TaxID=181124 RepID=A0A9P7RP28_9AGAR|nr:uncharacterized protein E1B28_013190 [Marasmius oreades]KAG7087209.1 hypothetical protein E1B28_013190 [Marasmius oreades]
MFRSFFVCTLLLLVLSPSYLLLSISTSNGTLACDDPTALAWYTSSVGETPCMTYQRLRRICNSDFQVGLVDFDSLPASPDSMCSDQISACCCNHIAFNLGMLCLACQQGLGDGEGFNASPGTYQRYLTGQRTDGTFCSPHTNETLADSVQAGVCKQDMKMISNLYEGDWPDGSWFYTYFSENATLALNSQGDKAFHSCPATSSSSSQIPSTGSPSSTSPFPSTGVSNSTSPLAFPSTGFPNYTSTSTSISNAHISGGAIAGISVSVPTVVLLIIATTVYLVCRSRRRKRDHGFTPYILPPPFTTPVSRCKIGGTGTPSSNEMSAEWSNERVERTWMLEGEGSEGDQAPPTYQSHAG